MLNQKFRFVGIHFDSVRLEIALGLGIGVFAALGLVHFVLIGSRHDRAWLKYAFVTLDIAILSLLMATQPIYDSVDVPQAMSFRNTIFPFYFLILGIAAFSFSPGLVVWCGIMVVTGWLCAFAWAIRDMPTRLEWTDISTTPTTEHFISIFLNPNFVGSTPRPATWQDPTLNHRRSRSSTRSMSC